MILKKLGYRSEAIINLIANRLLNGFEVVWHEGKPWTGISQHSLSELLKCTQACIYSHIRKLADEGVLLKAQLRSNEHDHTNYYCINEGVLEDENLASFFSKSITNKILKIYNINKSTINHNKSIARTNARVIADAAKQQEEEKPAKKKLAVSCAVSCVAASTGVTTSDVSPNPAQSAPPLQRTTTAQDMLRIWNEELDREDELSKETSKYLVASYQRKFDCSLPRWKEYVLGLRRSTYIMRKLLTKFGKYLLKWALSFKVINRIFAGGFGCGLTTPEATSAQIGTAEEHINSLSESESCKEVRRLVVETYGESVYLSWFRQIELREQDGEMLIRGRSFVVEAIKLRYLQGCRFVEDPVYERLEDIFCNIVEHAEAPGTASSLFGS